MTVIFFRSRAPWIEKRKTFLFLANFLLWRVRKMRAKMEATSKVRFIYFFINPLKDKNSFCYCCYFATPMRNIVTRQYTIHKCKSGRPLTSWYSGFELNYLAERKSKNRFCSLHVDNLIKHKFFHLYILQFILLLT